LAPAPATPARARENDPHAVITKNTQDARNEDVIKKIVKPAPRQPAMTAAKKPAEALKAK
jgi:hypothetical protein